VLISTARLGLLPTVSSVLMSSWYSSTFSIFAFVSHQRDAVSKCRPYLYACRNLRYGTQCSQCHKG